MVGGSDPEQTPTNAVTSADGTRIAYERQGSGPSVILVGGGLDDGSENRALAAELAAHFTVYNFARRGRGASGDTAPYALEREFEDLEAVLAEAGGSAHLFGVSSGGALVLEAAAAGVPANRLAVYEVPYRLDPAWPARWRGYTDALGAALEAGDRGGAVALFLAVTGSDSDNIARVRASPYWPALEALAHTLAYDAACLGDGRPPTARLATIEQPTLVATGDDRPPEAAAWVLALDEAADAIAASVPRGERRTVSGQGHVVDPETFAPVLVEFFA